MKFCWSTINVKNLEETIDFYESIIGLRVMRRFVAGPKTEIAFLGDGRSTELEFIFNEDHKDIGFGSDISWGFEVESVDEMVELAKEKGIEILSEIISPNPSIRFFFIKDPNGLRIQLVENLA
ncbi:MAG: VOC family protein [Tissierellaceae bacterium]